MHKQFGFWIIAAIIAAVGVWAFFPVSTDDKGILTSLALSVALCVLQAGTVWFFLSSLRTFKRHLKIAYYILSAGIISFGLTMIQIPLTVILKLELPILLLMPVIFYLASALLIYFSARKLARLLDLHSRLTSGFIVCALAVGTALAALFLPLPFLPEEAKFSAGLFGMGAVFFMVAAILTWRLSDMIGAVYKRATRYLAYAFMLLVAATIHELVVKITWEDGWYIDYGISLWPYLVANGLLLTAGITFKASSATSARFLGNKNYVDVITTLAGLIPNPKVMDKELDKLRAITASSSASTQLSEKDKKILLSVYIKLEHFLITSDPIRKYTKEEIRLSLPDDFSQDLNDYEKTNPGKITT